MEILRAANMRLLDNLPNKPFELKEPRISSSKNYWARSLLDFISIGFCRGEGSVVSKLFFFEPG